MKKNNLMERAYHEAGHAIIALFLDIKFQYVTIRRSRKEDYSGLLKISQHSVSSDDTERIFREICLCFGGPYAEHLYTGSWSNENAIRCLKDIEEANNLAMIIAQGDRKIQYVIISRAEKVVNSLLSTYWKAVEALATELAKRKAKIWYIEVYKIFYEALSDAKGG